MIEILDLQSCRLSGPPGWLTQSEGKRVGMAVARLAVGGLAGSGGVGDRVS